MPHRLSGDKNLAAQLYPDAMARGGRSRRSGSAGAEEDFREYAKSLIEWLKENGEYIKSHSDTESEQETRSLVNDIISRYPIKTSGQTTRIESNDFEEVWTDNDNVELALGQLQLLREEELEAQARLRFLARLCNERGVSWDVIAETIGVSKSAAHERFTDKGQINHRERARRRTKPSTGN